MIWRYTLSGFAFGGTMIGLSLLFETDPMVKPIGWAVPFLLSGFVGFVIGLVRKWRAPNL